MNARNPITAVIVAGGTSRRFGGPDEDKLDADLNGAPLLLTTVRGLPSSWPLVIVGPRRHAIEHLRPDATWVREEPALGGPAAGLVTGAQAANTPFVAVLAGDTPEGGRALSTLWAAAAEPRNAAERGVSGWDGVQALDPEGRPQPLLAIYRRSAVLDAAAARESVQNMAVRRLVEPLHLTTCTVDADAAADVDTLADLERRRNAPRSLD